MTRTALFLIVAVIFAQFALKWSWQEGRQRQAVATEPPHPAAAVTSVYRAYGLATLLPTPPPFSSLPTVGHPHNDRVSWRAIVLLSEMCSGSSILQETVTLNTHFRRVTYTPMFEHELDFFGKAATILTLPDLDAPLAVLNVQAPRTVLPGDRGAAADDLLDLLRFNGLQRLRPSDPPPVCDTVAASVDQTAGGKGTAVSLLPAACQRARELNATLRADVDKGAAAADLLVSVRDAFCALVHLRGGHFFEKTPGYLMHASAVAALAAVRASVHAVGGGSNGGGSSLCRGLSLEPVLLVRHPLDVVASANRRWNDDPGYNLRRWTRSYTPMVRLAEAPSLGPSLPVVRYEDFVDDPRRALAPVLGSSTLAQTLATGSHGPIAVQRHNATDRPESRGGQANDDLLALLDEEARAALAATAAHYGYTLPAVVPVDV